MTFDLDDWVFWAIALGGLILIARLFSYKKQHEDEQHKTGIAEEQYKQALIAEDKENIPTGWTVELWRFFVSQKAQRNMDVEAQLKLAKGMSKIHLDELKGEHKAVLEAAKNADAYERRRQRNGPVQAPQFRRPVPQADGQEPRGGDAQPQLGGDRKKANIGFSKPRKPD